ncbi:MAG: hypothetical protein GXO62_02585, partial [Epsilonproteobacteria bacterium]|nr:hypothetical protein [Campylobacterota bacterium]
MIRLVLLLIAIRLFALSNDDVIANFWMDECEWYTDPIYDKKLYALDHSDNHYIAMADRNYGAVTIGDDKIIFRAGNFIGNRLLRLKYLEFNSDPSVYRDVLINDYISLPDTYTLKAWVKFPLDDAGHNEYDEDGTKYKYFYIADVYGFNHDKSLFYFKMDDDGNVYWCVGEKCSSSALDVSDGWHMFTYVADDGSTTLYIDKDQKGSLDTLITGDVCLIGAGDYDGSAPYNTLGAYMDELIIFNKALSSDEIKSVYSNEKMGRNFDGTVRYKTPTITPLEIEAGRVDMPDTFNGDKVWTHVEFNESFSQPPLIFAIAASNDEHNDWNPANVRFKNITEHGFDITVVEPKPNDGVHYWQTLDYIAITPGVHILGNQYVQVLTKDTAKVQYNYRHTDAGKPDPIIWSDKNDFGWDELELEMPMCPKIVLSHIQTLNNQIDPIPGNPLNPWDTAVVKELDSNKINFALDLSETNYSVVENPETVAFLIMEGNFTDSFDDDYNNTIDYEGQYLRLYFLGYQNYKKYQDFLNSYDDTPVGVAGKSSRRGWDGGWARRWEIDKDKVSFVTDEDLYTDDERYHIEEDYGFLVFSQPFHKGGIKSVIEYRMDECTWDDDPNTYEVKNSGEYGSDYDLSAGNEANVTDGFINRGGDFISDDEHDKYLKPKNEIPLPDNYTLNVWVKFPLNTDGHIVKDDNKFFNIADRPGSDSDFIYFAYKTDKDSWGLCVEDDNGASCHHFHADKLDGWHMLSFVVDVADGNTTFYLDSEKNLTFDAAPSGKLGLMFNSDYKSDNDNEPNGQSLGAVADEFDIFDKMLSKTWI